MVETQDERAIINAVAEFEAPAESCGLSGRAET